MENVSILLLFCLDKCSLFSVILIRMFLRFTLFMIVVYNTTLRHENVNKSIPRLFVCVSVTVQSLSGRSAQFQPEKKYKLYALKIHQCNYSR